MGGRRSDIDAHALKREHLQSFYFGYDLTFFDYEVVRMIVIVDVIVHSFASNYEFFSASYKQESPRGAGIPCLPWVDLCARPLIAFPWPWTTRSPDSYSTLRA